MAKVRKHTTPRCERDRCDLGYWKHKPVRLTRFTRHMAQRNRHHRKDVRFQTRFRIEVDHG